MEYLNNLMLQVESEDEEGNIRQMIWTWEDLRKVIKETWDKITRVLLREFTPKEQQFLDIRIKQDMVASYLYKDMCEDPLTSHQN